MWAILTQSEGGLPYCKNILPVMFGHVTAWCSFMKTSQYPPLDPPLDVVQCRLDVLAPRLAGILTHGIGRLVALSASDAADHMLWGTWRSVSFRSRGEGEGWPRNRNEMGMPCRWHAVYRRCMYRVAVAAEVGTDDGDPSRRLRRLG